MNLSWIPSLIFYLVGILILALTFKRCLHHRNPSSGNHRQYALEQEHHARFVRNKLLPPEFFIHINSKAFPSVSNANCQKIYLSLVRFDQIPMVNLKGESNLKLKMTYGPQVIESVGAYEKNYFEFMDILFNYGKILYENNYIEEAQITLEEGLRYQCDLSKCYLLLIKIYKHQNNHVALYKLQTIVKTEMQDSPFLNKVLCAF